MQDAGGKMQDARREMRETICDLRFAICRLATPRASSRQKGGLATSRNLR